MDDLLGADRLVTLAALLELVALLVALALVARWLVVVRGNRAVLDDPRPTPAVQRALWPVLALAALAVGVTWLALGDAADVADRERIDALRAAATLLSAGAAGLADRRRGDGHPPPGGARGGGRPAPSGGRPGARGPRRGRRPAGGQRGAGAGRRSGHLSAWTPSAAVATFPRTRERRWSESVVTVLAGPWRCPAARSGRLDPLANPDRATVDPPTGSGPSGAVQGRSISIQSR